MPARLKCQIIVVAGVIPGMPVKEYTRQWNYTSEDYEKDAECPEGEETILARYVREAAEYQQQLTDPRAFNFVINHFMWM